MVGRVWPPGSGCKRGARGLNGRGKSTGRGHGRALKRRRTPAKGRSLGVGGRAARRRWQAGAPELFVPKFCLATVFTPAWNPAGRHTPQRSSLSSLKSASLPPPICLCALRPCSLPGCGRDSNSGHQLLLPTANWCPIFASRTTQGATQSSGQWLHSSWW